MGRWGNKIYQSDSALDFFATIIHQLEREIAYWISPEQVLSNGWWLAQVLAVIEMMLLFDQHDIGSTVYLRNPNTVQRWRETFLRVWDGDWKHDYEYGGHIYAYDEPDYRIQHRPGIVAMFHRLESIARDWAKRKRSDDPLVLIPLHHDYPLPYFSIKRWMGQDNKVHMGVEHFISNLFSILVKEILYYLSMEMRNEVTGFNLYEEVWTAVDMLGFLSEIYQRPPGINEQAVRNWRNLTDEIWKPLLTEDDMMKWDETEALYQTAKATFDRLEAMAKKYPPIEW
jgi:hypothetical protein